MWKRGLLAQLVTISVLTSGVDSSTRVSWMLLQCAFGDGDDSVPILRRGDETHTRTNNVYRTPFTITDGGRTLWQEEYQVRVQNRNVQPLYFYHYPGHPLINSIKPRSPSTRHRMQSAQFTAYSATNPVHYMPCLSQ